MNGGPSGEMVMALVPPLHRLETAVEYWPNADAGAPITLLLPASDCSVRWVDIAAATPRQAAAAARAQILAAAIDQDVHVVAVPSDGPIPVATVSHHVMRHWIDWAEANDRKVTAVMPAALALPEPSADAVSVVTLGSERIARTATRAFVLEPGMADILTGGAAKVECDPQVIVPAMVANRPMNLLSGPYAPPRANWFTRERLQAMAALIALILLVSLAIGVARLVRLHADIARIDADAATLTSAALGREIAIDNAIGELDARLAATGTSRGSANATLAALMQAMEAQSPVGIDTASWDRAGTLTVTLGAPRAEDINPVLLALQSAGYRVTAQPRSGTDGRALGDITIRSEP
jgi:general secretion pathway protein L